LSAAFPSRKEEKESQTPSQKAAVPWECSKMEKKENEKSIARKRKVGGKVFIPPGKKESLGTNIVGRATGG